MKCLKRPQSSTTIVAPITSLGREREPTVSSGGGPPPQGPLRVPVVTPRSLGIPPVADTKPVRDTLLTPTIGLRPFAPTPSVFRSYLHPSRGGATEMK